MAVHSMFAVLLLIVSFVQAQSVRIVQTQCNSNLTKPDPPPERDYKPDAVAVRIRKIIVTGELRQTFIEKEMKWSRLEISLFDKDGNPIQQEKVSQCSGSCSDEEFDVDMLLRLGHGVADTLYLHPPKCSLPNLTSLSARPKKCQDVMPYIALENRGKALNLVPATKTFDDQFPEMMQNSGTPAVTKGYWANPMSTHEPLAWKRDLDSLAVTFKLAEDMDSHPVAFPVVSSLTHTGYDELPCGDCSACNWALVDAHAVRITKVTVSSELRHRFRDKEMKWSRLEISLFDKDSKPLQQFQVSQCSGSCSDEEFDVDMLLRLGHGVADTLYLHPPKCSLPNLASFSANPKKCQDVMPYIALENRGKALNLVPATKTFDNQFPEMMQNSGTPAVTKGQRFVARRMATRQPHAQRKLDKLAVTFKVAVDIHGHPVAFPVVSDHAGILSCGSSACE